MRRSAEMLLCRFTPSARLIHWSAGLRPGVVETRLKLAGAKTGALAP